MGFDNDCILNIQSLSGEYFCAVCRLLVYPNEALQAPCTHLFCKPCLTYVVSTNHACPYDGYRVTEADSKPLVESNKTLADTIGKIQVHCLYYRTGCTWQGSLSDCTSHCATCGFGESPVLCNRCGIQLVHRQVQEHAQNCPGAQSQGQQPSATQGAAPTGAGSGTDQNQPVAQIGAPASQGPISQAMSLSASSQVTNQPANSATQTQAAQAAAPSLDQWYQQQYQQYYQQYPGYDAYQQNYQYYYAQQQPPAQPPVQSEPPQAPPAGQPQPQPQAQPASMQVQTQTHVQAQAGQMYGQPQQQAQATQPYGQNQQQAQTAQSYPHPQQHPVPHQQMQPPHPQSYPQSQTQHYQYPQNQGPLQPPPQPNPQAPYPPPQQNQPVVPGPQIQGQNPVTGFQSYPQPHPPQVQAPQMHPTGVHQQPQYGGQMHGQFPSQPSQMRPPHPYPTVPTQQQPALGPPAQQLPVYPHGHQPGYGVPHRPGIQVVPQQHLQQFPGQAPFMQPQLHAQGSSQIQPQNYAAPPGAHPNMAQNFAGRPMVPQGAVSQPYEQVRPVHPNQTYPMKANDQLSVVSELPVHPQQSSKIVNGEKPLDQKPEKAIMGDGQSKEVRNSTGVTGLNQAINWNEGKKDVSLESASELPGGRGTESKLVGDHDQGQQRLKENIATSAAEDIKGANLKDTKHTASASALPQSHVVRQGHSGPTAQVRHGVPSIPHGIPHPGNMHQPALPGHPTNQLRPQGPGQVPAGPPFHAGDNAPPSAPFDKPGNVGQYHPRTPQGEPFLRPSFPAQHSGAFDSHGGVIGREGIEPRPPYPLENEQFPPLRMGYSDSRHPEPHFRGPVEGASHRNIPPVQSGSSKFSGPSGHGTMRGPGMHDERVKPLTEEHFKSFPHREFEDDLRKYPRPSHLEAVSSNFGGRFPSSAPLDRGPHMLDSDGPSRPFDKGPRGFERDSGLKMDPDFVSGSSRLLPPFHPNDGGSERAAGFPVDDMERSDFGRHPASVPESGFGSHRVDGLPSGSPGRDHTGFPPRRFGGYRDVDRIESRLFEGSKPYNFPPNHLHMGDHLGEGHNNQDMPPSHFRRGEHMGPHGLHLRDGAAFGHSGGLPQMGEPPIGEHLRPHVPFGGENPRHLVGEPGFGSGFAYQHHARDGGFNAGDLEPFDNWRKRKLGGNMCLLCQVECGTVEGLDLHAQSRDHQRKALDIAINIKQQNKKQQKRTVDQGSGGGGRGGSKSKTSFERRGNKR